MHRVKHGPMDPCFFLPFFGPVGEGKAPWGQGCPVSPCVPCVLCVPCVPCVPCAPCVLCGPLCSLCPLYLVCPVSLVSLVFPVSCCVPCVPCLVCPLSLVSPVSLVSLVSPVSPVSLLPFKKNEMFGGVALVSYGMWRENFDGFLCFHMTTCWFFFARAGGQRM